mgnify:CR=1 FL=1
MIKLTVDYFYDVEGEEPTTVRKIYTGLDEGKLVQRAKENEHYNTCTRVEFVNVEYDK